MEAKITITINNGHLDLSKENIDLAHIPRILIEVAEQLEKWDKERNPVVRTIQVNQ